MTINGAHVFIKDAPGGKEEANHTPANLRFAPPSHAPGHENPERLPSSRFSHTGLPNASTPVGGKRPGWMAAVNARQIAKSERLAKEKFNVGTKPKHSFKETLARMKPMPKPADTYRGHQRQEDTSLRVHLYGSTQG